MLFNNMTSFIKYNYCDQTNAWMNTRAFEAIPLHNMMYLMNILINEEINIYFYAVLVDGKLQDHDILGGKNWAMLKGHN